MKKHTALTLHALLNIIDRVWFCKTTDVPDNAGAARYLVSDLINEYLLDVINDTASAKLWDAITSFADENAPDRYYTDLDFALASTLQTNMISAEAFCNSENTELTPEQFVDYAIRLAVGLGADLSNEKLSPALLLQARQAGSTPLSAAIAALGDINEIRDPAQQKGDESSSPLNPAQDLTAALEGWCLSTVYSPDPNTRWELQKLDEHLHFDTDLDAWLFVTKQAQSGSVLHQNALNFIALHAKPEYDEIVSKTAYAR